MTLFNVTFTDVDVERTITLDADSEELANYIAKASYGRADYEWDGRVQPAPEPPPTVLDADNVDHPNYAEFAGAQVGQETAQEEAPDVSE